MFDLRFEHAPAKRVRFADEPTLTPARLLAVFFGTIFVLYGAIDIIARLNRGAGLSTKTPAATVLARPIRTASVQTPVTPERLIIDSIGVDASVEPVGLNASGNMAVPSSYTTTSWYRDGARVGAAGSTVIAGHLNNSLGRAGVFERLHELSLGDSVVVEGEGVRVQYTVTEMTVYDATEAPTDTIFTTAGPSRLVLITCNGAWDNGARSYEKRLVIVAEPR